MARATSAMTGWPGSSPNGRTDGVWRTRLFAFAHQILGRERAELTVDQSHRVPSSMIRPPIANNPWRAGGPSGMGCRLREFGTLIRRIAAMAPLRLFESNRHANKSKQRREMPGHEGFYARLDGPGARRSVLNVSLR